jgi:hypothetical protein
MSKCNGVTPAEFIGALRHPENTRLRWTVAHTVVDLLPAEHIIEMQLSFPVGALGASAADEGQQATVPAIVARSPPCPRLRFQSLLVMARANWVALEIDGLVVIGLVDLGSHVAIGADRASTAGDAVGAAA